MMLDWLCYQFVLSEHGRTIASETAVSTAAPIILEPEHPEDSLVAELLEFRKLGPGWDGEQAAEPSWQAIRDAARFAHAAGEWCELIDPTLHVDGSVILEIGDLGSLRFNGDGQVIYALDGIGRGKVHLDGFSVPKEIRSALTA